MSSLRNNCTSLVHTFRCIHNKAKSLLCAQYQVRSPTHSTHRTTRAQTYTSLNIPRFSKSAGAKSPAFFSTLLWNDFLAISALFLLYIHFGKSLWFTWIPCNEASACRVSIILKNNNNIVYMYISRCWIRVMSHRSALSQMRRKYSN